MIGEDSFLGDLNVLDVNTATTIVNQDGSVARWQRVQSSGAYWNETKASSEVWLLQILS